MVDLAVNQACDGVRIFDCGVVGGRPLRFYESQSNGGFAATPVAEDGYVDALGDGIWLWGWLDAVKHVCFCGECGKM